MLVVKNPPTNAGDTSSTHGLGGKIPGRKEWQPTPVFLPGKSHGQRSLEGYCSWGGVAWVRHGWACAHTHDLIVANETWGRCVEHFCALPGGLGDWLSYYNKLDPYLQTSWHWEKQNTVVSATFTQIFCYFQQETPNSDGQKIKKK